VFTFVNQNDPIIVLKISSFSIFSNSTIFCLFYNKVRAGDIELTTPGTIKSINPLCGKQGMNTYCSTLNQHGTVKCVTHYAAPPSFGYCINSHVCYG
jgi:hypothetical protein